MGAGLYVRRWIFQPASAAIFFSIKSIEKSPHNRIPYGSDVLCFIGENPGCEKSQPGFFMQKKEPPEMNRMAQSIFSF